MMINELKQQYKGTTLPKLIEHHIKKQSSTEIRNAVMGTYIKLPEVAREGADEYTMDYLANWFDSNIVNEDLSNVFSKAIANIENTSNEQGWNLSESQKVDVFVIMVLRMAFFAHDKPELRKMLGIKKGWFS